MPNLFLKCTFQQRFEIYEEKKGNVITISKMIKTPVARIYTFYKKKYSVTNPWNINFLLRHSDTVWVGSASSKILNMGGEFLSNMYKFDILLISRGQIIFSKSNHLMCHLFLNLVDHLCQVQGISRKMRRKQGLPVFLLLYFENDCYALEKFQIIVGLHHVSLEFQPKINYSLL